MTVIRTRMLAGVALPLLLAVPAAAADLAVKSPPPRYGSTLAIHNWSGFYAGVNAGGALAYSGDPTSSASCSGAGFALGSYLACGDIPSINAAGTGSISRGLFVGGVQTGYNWQFNSAVFGVEADFDAFHPHASRTGTMLLPVSGRTATVTNSVDANWLFTARGRFGWAFDNNVLGYVTGGLAVTDLKASNSYTDDSTPGFGAGGTGTWSTSTTKVGWTVGAGAEYALSQNWSLRAEYLYVHFSAITSSGTITDTSASYGSAISTVTDLSAHIARAGVNYKF